MIIFAIATMIYVFPWFLIAIVLCAVVFGYVYIIFKAGVRELKRMDNTTRYFFVSALHTTNHFNLCINIQYKVLNLTK